MINSSRYSKKMIFFIHYINCIHYTHMSKKLKNNTFEPVIDDRYIKLFEEYRKGLININDAIINSTTDIKNDVRNYTSVVENNLVDIKNELASIKEIVSAKTVKVNSTLIDVKEDPINLPHNIIMAALSSCSAIADAQLIKEYYIREPTPSIKYINSRKYEYFTDGKWISDTCGNQLFNVLIKCLRNTYLKHNIVNEHDDPEMDLFIKYQSHITNMSNDKQYYKEFQRSIASLLQ